MNKLRIRQSAAKALRKKGQVQRLSRKGVGLKRVRNAQVREIWQDIVLSLWRHRAAKKQGGSS